MMSPTPTAAPRPGAHAGGSRAGAHRRGNVAARGTALALLAVLALLGASCRTEVTGRELHAEGVEADDGDPAAVPASVTAIDAVATTSYRALAANTDDNFLTSPWLTTRELLALRAASGGTTTEAIDSLLGGMHAGDVERGVRHLLDSLERHNGEQLSEQRRGTVAVGDAVGMWVHAGREVSPAWLAHLARAQRRGVHQVDFGAAAEDLTGAIDRWLAETSDDRCASLPDGGLATRDVDALVVSCLWFTAPWHLPFDAARTRDGTFTLPDGGEATVPMLALPPTDGILYAATDDWQAVELPYLGEGFALLVLVPRADRFDAVEASLAPEVLDQVRHALEPRRVELHMPTFHLRAAFSMSTALAAMDADELMDPTRADLGGMVTGGDAPALGDMVQLVELVVDADGSGAGAATVDEPERNPATGAVTLRADRPFIVAVTERDSAVPLLIGRVVDPRR